MTRLLQLSGNGNNPLLFHFFCSCCCFFFVVVVVFSPAHRKMNRFFSITVQRDTQWVGPHWFCLSGCKELSVLGDTSPMMSVPCLVVGDQNCLQCLTFWALVWCGTLYIPCASQSRYVTITREINHTMNSFGYSGPQWNDPLYSKAISIMRHWYRHSLFYCEELIAINLTSFLGMAFFL